VDTPLGEGVFTIQVDPGWVSRLVRADAHRMPRALEGERYDSPSNGRSRTVLSRAFASFGDFGLCWLVIGGLVCGLLVLTSPLPSSGAETATLTRFLSVGIWLGVLVGMVAARGGSHDKSHA